MTEHASIAKAIETAMAAPAAQAAAITTTARLGNCRYFGSQAFHFQTLRALMDIPAGGAETGEVLETVKAITDGDQQSWFTAWSATGERVLKLAEATTDRISKGGAYLRAHNYFRTSEFFLPPGDPKRPISWEKNTSCFYKGLDLLGVSCERFRAPYPGGGLQANYFPDPSGANDRPLLVFVGGFDSTLEELYFILVPAAHARGYSVLTYEGPGQGAALRQQGLRFIPEWERPNSAVLDAFLNTYRKPTQIVLIGMSMGGYLAPRAAAFDSRVDGVVAFDVCFDLGECAGRVLAAAANPAAWRIPDFVWAVNNAQWTLGATDIDSIRTTAAAYTLRPVAERIRQHVLILAGEQDHFIPSHQVGEFERSLVNARSVTTRVFDAASGGAEHCQIGNVAVMHAALFDWLEATFGGHGD